MPFKSPELAVLKTFDQLLLLLLLLLLVVVVVVVVAVVVVIQKLKDQDI